MEASSLKLAVTLLMFRSSMKAANLPFLIVEDAKKNQIFGYNYTI